MSNTIIQERKVFCTDCAYFNSCRRSNARMQFDDENLHEICTAPQNVRATYKSDGSDKYISVPSIINKYNNCQWFINACRPDDVTKLLNLHNTDPASHPYILEQLSCLNDKINETGEQASYKLGEHESDKNNPHEVTKDQVGLGNVDNTSDADKPISTEQQKKFDELNKKIDAETIRASGEEARIIEIIAETGGSVKAETERAMLAETELKTNITNVETKLDNEIDRAKNVEASHQTHIEALQQNLATANTNITNNTNSINNEILRAIDAEKKINADVTSLTNKTVADIASAKLECKQYAESQDTVTLNAAKSYTGEAKIDAIAKSELYTNQVKAELEKEIDEKTKVLWKIVGSVNYRADLDTIASKEVGNVYIVKYHDDGTRWDTEFVWTAEGKWEELGGIVDLRDYYTKIETDGLIATAKKEAIDEAKSLDNILHLKITEEVAVAKQGAITESETKSRQLDTELHTTITGEIATAKSEATTESKKYADDKDVELHTTITGEVAVAKQEAINEAEAKDETRYIQVTKDIATSLDSAKSYTDKKIEAIVGPGGKTIDEAIAEAEKYADDKDTELHAAVTAEIATAKKEAIDSAEEKSRQLDTLLHTTITGEIATAKFEAISKAEEKDEERYAIVTSDIATAVAPKANSADVYTKNEVDAKDKEIKDTYLPLVGEKIVTGTVEFQKTLKVKNSITSPDTLTINTESLIKTSNAGAPTVTLILPDQSGTLARTAEFQAADTALKNELTASITAVKSEANKYTDDKDTALKNELTASIATAKSEAIKDADEKNDALEIKLTKAISTAKSEIEKYADDKDVELHTVVTTEIDTAKTEAIKDADTKNDALETKLIKKIDDATSGISTSIADHVLNVTDAHDVDNRLNTAIQTSKDYADAKDTEKYTQITNETNTKINEVKSTYLPLTGEKAVTGSVEFQKGIKVKDSVIGAESLSIGTTSLIKSSTAAGTIDVVYSLPSASGTLARLSDIEKVSGDITTRLDTAEGKITVLENKVPSSITGTIVETSVSTDKDVPNNYAVKTALNLKANKTDVESSLKDKANKNETYTKIEVNNLLGDKANTSDVNDALALKANKTTTLSGYGITNAYTKDEVYTKDYIDTALTAKASTTYVKDQLVYKADAATTYSKDDVDTKLGTKADRTYVDNNFIKSTEVLETYATKTELTNGLSTKANIAFVSTAISEVKDLITTGDTNTLEQARKYTDEKVTGTYRVKPPVETYDDLPTEGNVVGDVRNVRSGTYAGANFVWTDTLEWDKLSETVDISGKQDTTTAVKHGENTPVGNSSTPVYVQSNGQVAAINKDSAVTENSVNLITSGAVFNSLKDKVTNDTLTAALATKANVGDSYIKDEENKLLDLKANKTDVENSLKTKADSDSVYSKTDTDGFLSGKADKSDTYNKAKVDELLADKADNASVFTKDEITAKLELKANSSDVYKKTDTETRIETARINAIAESNKFAHEQDDEYLKTANTTAHGYADTARDEAITNSKAYTDTQIAAIKNRHYDIKTILPDEDDPTYYTTFDYATNNIDLTGITGKIYIYLPTTTSALTGKARELIVNISNRSVDTCEIYFVTRNGEAATFRDGGILETVKTKKEEFSLRFQEYNESKFLVDEVGVGDTINNDKINITADQVTILDDHDGTKYKFVITDGQLKVVPVV